jgi:hypothetical protein
MAQPTSSVVGRMAHCASGEANWAPSKPPTNPSKAPFAVSPVSVVTNAGKFLRAYLGDLRWWLEHPEGYAAPSLTDILSKLADAGLELKLCPKP